MAWRRCSPSSPPTASAASALPTSSCSAPRCCARWPTPRGALSRTLGGPQTICWALLLAAPLTIAVTFLSAPGGHVGTDAWLGFAYVSLVSMFLGFFAWYAGLALGGVAKAGQTQLFQTPLTLALSAAVLGEHVSLLAIACTLVVLASIVGTQRARVRRN